MTERRQEEAGESGSAATEKPKPTARKTPDTPDTKAAPDPVEEIGGPKGPEPTRYGDWEKGGRCSDF